MRKRYIFIILILLFIILTIGAYFFIKSKELKVKIKDNKEININEKVYNTDYILNIKNGKIITKKAIIDTSKLGKQKITINIKNYFNKIKKYTYKINVIDKEKPKIAFSDNLTTEEGTEIDLLKNVNATDNSNEDIKVEVSGEYNFKKPGIYNLTYIAQDSSNNIAAENFTLTVKEKPKIITVTKRIDTKDTTFITSTGFTGYIKNGITYIDGYLIANKTYSLPSSYNPGLNSTVKTKANEMFAAAKNEGLNIWLSSGFRSYNTQKNLYNNYVNRDGKNKADTYSARPGHSEHQSGLAFDVNQINSTFDNTPEANWLANNCYKYGFILRYPNGKTNETGYKYESWHFRYVGEDLATKLYNDGNWITLESYFGITSEYNY